MNAALQRAGSPVMYLEVILSRTTPSHLRPPFLKLSGITYIGALPSLSSEIVFFNKRRLREISLRGSLKLGLARVNISADSSTHGRSR